MRNRRRWEYVADDGYGTAKERELESTLGDLKTLLKSSNKSLADYKQRATSAEVRPAEGFAGRQPLILVFLTFRHNWQQRTTIQSESSRFQRRSRRRTCSLGRFGTKVGLRHLQPSVLYSPRLQL